MAEELLKRVQNSTALNAPVTAGLLPQDEYPRRPHQLLANSTVQTDLATIHEFLETNLEDTTLDTEAREAWEKETRTLHSKYFFTASTTNKWSKFTFDTWEADIKTLVLMHVVAQYSSIESSAEGSGSRKLFEPSTAKVTSNHTARSRASKFCPELLYDHGLQINTETINDDLNKYAKLIHPSQYANATVGTERQRQTAKASVQIFTGVIGEYGPIHDTPSLRSHFASFYSSTICQGWP